MQFAFDNFIGPFILKSGHVNGLNFLLLPLLFLMRDEINDHACQNRLIMMFVPMFFAYGTKLAHLAITTH